MQEFYFRLCFFKISMHIVIDNPLIITISNRYDVVYQYIYRAIQDFSLLQPLVT